jgi:hypothetical protein
MKQPKSNNKYFNSGQNLIDTSNSKNDLTPIIVIRNLDRLILRRDFFALSFKK